MVIIFLLLILLAMELIGVYLLGSLEDYYLDSFSENLASQSQIIASWLTRYMTKTPGEDDAERQAAIERLTVELGEDQAVEVIVIDPEGVILASSEREDPLVGKHFSAPGEVAAALAGSPSEIVRVDAVTGQRRLYLSVPVQADGQVLGALYLSASLEKIYATLAEIRAILFSATILALAVTAVSGFVLSRTITGPIREITTRAGRLAKGEFDQEIRIHSQDEIGQLASMFNYLAGRLRQTLVEISSEKGKVEAIINYMADGLLALDQEGRVLLINPAAARIFHLNPEGVVGGPLARVMPELDTLSRAKSRDGSPHPLQPWTEQLSLPDGLVLRAHFAPLWDGAAQVTGTVIVLQDITEQEKLTSLRKEFVANVSHELRTPLTSIKSYVETLLDGALQDQDVTEKFLGVVASETDRMARLVSDLLQLSRLDYDEADWDRTSFHLGDLAREVLVKMAGPIERKGHWVGIDAEPGLPPAWGDRDKIQQVLINLVGNAVEYTSPGGTISVELAGRGGGRLEVAVRDNGVGIPPKDLPRVFDRFYRVDKGRSRELGGTGLGLSIAREIVERHGGSMGIESAPGEGTRVWFTLDADEQPPGEGRSVS